MLSSELDLHLYLSALLFSMLLTSQPVPSGGPQKLDACISVCVCVCVCFVTVLSDSFATSWTVTHQAPLSTGFPRQACWSGLPFPSPGDLPNPGIKLRSSVHLLHYGEILLLLRHWGSPSHV